MVSMKLIAVIAILGFGLANGQSSCTCKYTNQLWGDANPNLYYYCNTATNTAVQVQCPSGYGFINNGVTSGCVPWAQWPTNCVRQVYSVPTCTSSNLNTPLATLNPNQYYLCLGVGQCPTLLTCVSGRGFVSNGGYLGCAEWAQWRSINNCYNSY